MNGDDVQKRLTEIRGIGAWINNFRLFALGSGCLAANDLALQEGMKRLKNLVERPSAGRLRSAMRNDHFVVQAHSCFGTYTEFLSARYH